MNTLNRKSVNLESCQRVEVNSETFSRFQFYLKRYTGAKLMEASGINNLMRGIAKTKTYSHNLQKAFKVEKFKSSVFEPISQMRQSIYAAVIQTKIGDDIKEAEHIARWKKYN